MGHIKKKAEPKKTVLTRKEERKEKRLLKKKARSKFFEAKINRLKGKTGPKMVEDPVKVTDKEKKSPKVTDKSPKKAQLTTFDRLQQQMKNQRKRQLLEANEDEDKEIKFLEKRLKLANKKKVSSSKAFTESGLDYILDVIDPDKKESALSAEVNFDEADSDIYDDIAMVQSDNVEKSTEKNKSKAVQKEDVEKRRKVRFSDETGETDSENDDFENIGDNEFSSHESDEESLKNLDGSDSESIEDDKIDGAATGKLKEDIYGRLRDEKGNVVKQTEGKYVPPHLRNLDESSDAKSRRELIRQLKGSLNRLALNNMHSIANQVEELYSKNSRHSMNEAIFDLYIQSLVLTVLSPEKLIVDHALLVAVLHANIGSEVGAYLLQKFILKFDSLLSTCPEVENKETDNLLLLISYLYDFKLFEAVLIYDILNKLSSELTEKNVELILIVLKCVGFSLRKDDPLAMKSFLLNVQKQMRQSVVEDQSRMKYMLEVLLSIKNNNISKISDFDPEQHEHLKKVLKTVIRSGNSIVALRIGLEDLLKAEERGRWWLVGSAWSKEDADKSGVKQEIAPSEQFSAQLIALAKKHRMNTDNRRNLFCILMSADDYRDAFEKILRLGLKGQQEREIPFVILHCLLQEKKYNPYYAYIADQLCTANRRHQMTLQCALWDKFRALDKLSPLQINILAKFLAKVFLSGSLPISVLKVVEFTELDKLHIRLLRQTILKLANEESRNSISQVFSKVSRSKKLTLFRESLRLFVHHFIVRNMTEGKLKDNVAFIYTLLTGDVV